MADFADLSVEIAHIYLDELDEKAAERAAETASTWMKHIFALAYEQKRVISTTVLVDDYSSAGGPSLAEAGKLIVNACQRHGIAIDHVVPESDCAVGVETMFDLIVEQPRMGAGSRGGEISAPARASGWLSNGDSMRLTYKDSSGDPFLISHKEMTNSEPRYRHSLFMDVQLWSEEVGRRLYSCPALASWWQLMRLGVDESVDGTPKLPDHIMSVHGAPPFFALKTLSILSLQFLEIEHAVRTILSQVFVPQSARQRWRRGPNEPGPQGHLDRIAYLFFPDGYQLLDRR